MSKDKLFNFIGSYHDKMYFLGLIIISALSLLYAFFVEYLQGFEPCILCLYQRIPYYLLIIIGIAGIVFKGHKYFLFLALGALLSSVLLSGYHAGVERGIFNPTDTCNAGINIPEGLSADQIRDMFYDKPIATCTIAAFKILGLSMTEWNFLFSCGLVAVTLVVLTHRR